ncbi:MAG: lytic transglycosylase domain-containing protein [Acidobacteria bacterium]|nr:lytic transglycosylase domain-containing protein [Acidobacteriota bacterium]
MLRKFIIAVVVAAVLLGLGIFAGHYYWTHRYDQLIIATAQKYKLDPALVKSVIYEESYFNPQARSAQNAVGLMQVTPITAQQWIDSTHTENLSEALKTITKEYKNRRPLKLEEALRDPAINLHIGCWYLQNLLTRYRGNRDALAVALAAYNAGPTNVERWVDDIELAKLSRDEFISRIEFPVTRNYVQKIIERYNHYNSKGGIG